ncbi:RNA methyltransferase [Xanthovirga aplysinae]|uniref:RNA methyltransferase n=1 Tax=Xanthovirga aplysinae TaxID=2529853 RepID=UPI0012BCD488|nr:RNA methyltransferase [Xanthovirga aplysinae]MTI30014.1 TrmH family RNA methyltransferase [Xanthovirga aplysinae]
MRKLKIEELNRDTVEEFKNKEKTPLVIVLDNVRSMNNVGSAFRTSDAFAIEKLYLCGITATPPHRDIHKTALGATESVEWEHVQDTIDIIQKLKKEGYQIVSVEQAQNSVSLEEFRPKENQKYCLIFGNEAFGVEDKVIEASDLCLEIPQFGTKHSLNISVSMGIVIWDVFQKMKF